MRNRHLLEKFMEENDIEYDVPFTVERTGYLGEKEQHEFKITKSDDYTGFELSYADSTKRMGNSFVVMQELMFSDKMRIVKMSWKPKCDDIYWYASIDGYVYSSTWTNHNDDLHRYILGNCFKTKKEAEKYRRDVFKMLDGEPFVKWAY